jgi:membrane-associated phospholipid phosphatase
MSSRAGAGLRAALAALLLAPSVRSETAPPPSRRLSSSPLVWAGGLTLTALLLDRSVHREVSIRDDTTINKLLGQRRYGRKGTVMDMMGQPQVTLGVSGLFYGAGLWLEDERARRVGKAGAEASLLAGGVALGIKWAVGRSRPYAGHDSDEYRPFQGDVTSRSSFPSGHSAVAFALGAVVADEYRDWRVDTLAYGAASAVAVSRIYQDRHWLSDIVGGAAVGIGIGKWTRRRSLARPSRAAVLTDGRKLYVAWRF